MRIPHVSAVLTAAGLLIAAPAFAQSTPDTNKPPASSAQKQKTQDGNSPTTVGPGSAAYKQRTQSLSHSDGSAAGVQKQN